MVKRFSVKTSGRIQKAPQRRLPKVIRGVRPQRVARPKALSRAKVRKLYERALLARFNIRRG